MIYINIIDEQRKIVSSCDEELLGKKYESKEDNLQLDIKENFYLPNDKKLSSSEEAIQTFRNMRKEDATFNIVGKEAVNAAVEAGIISQKDVREIQGIPFIMILL